MFRRHNAQLTSSTLFSQDDFYKAFEYDLSHAKSRVIIESPFITRKRVTALMPTFKQLLKNDIHITINTKPIEEHEAVYQNEVAEIIGYLEANGVMVLVTGGHHRKLAIIDRDILWEGSLNILSQNDSCEVMRRIYAEQAVNQMLAFLRLDKFIN